MIPGRVRTALPGKFELMLFLRLLSHVSVGKLAVWLSSLRDSAAASGQGRGGGRKLLGLPGSVGVKPACVSRGCCNKFSPSGGFNATDMCSLAVLKAGSLTSGCRQRGVPLGVQREGLFQAWVQLLLVADRPGGSPARDSLPPTSLSFFTWPPPPPLPVPLSPVTPVIGFTTHPPSG